MSLAAILVVCFSLPLEPNLGGFSWQQTNQQQTQSASGSTSSQTQTPAAQPAQNQPKPSPTKAKHRKSVPPDCTNAPAALKPVSDSAQPAKATGTETTGSGSAAAPSGNAGEDQSGSGQPKSTGAAPANPAAAKPCPPAKKVVRNGGSSEPAIELLPQTTTAEQSKQQSEVDQLLAAAEENLKKIAGRQLTADQQDTVSQIKQFMEQSKQAVAAGDTERAHNLAEKAKLLSEELVKQ